MFDAKDVREMMKLDEVQRGADETLEVCRNMIGSGSDGWVPIECYEKSMRLSKQLKEVTLAAATAANPAEIRGGALAL